MKWYIAVLLFGATAMAMPTGGGGGDGGHDGGDDGGDDGGHDGGDGGDGGSDYAPCQSTLFSNPQCCATDVLGVIGLDCANREFTPLILLLLYWN